MSLENKMYTIEKIRNLKDVSIHEREIRRKGHEVKLTVLEKGLRMILEYQDGSGILSTSLVQEVKEYDDYIRVYTMNTLYEFKKAGN